MTHSALFGVTDLLRAWPASLWPACWQGGLVALAVWAVVCVLPSMPARCQCWLWRVAILKFVVVLLLPPLVDVPLLPAPKISMQTNVEASLPAQKAMPMHGTHQVHVTRVKAIDWPSLPTVLHCLWLFGVGYSFLRFWFAWCSTRRLKRGGRAITAGPVLEQLRTQARLLGVRTMPSLIEVPGGGSPMLLGTFWPTIVLPAQTSQRLNEREQAMVLGHELAHIRRVDLFWGLIAAIVQSLFFFHPLAWLCQRQLKIAQEIAADELAIAKQKHDPVGYGSLLVSVVRKLGLTMGARPLVSTLSLETVGPVHSLTRRLVAMSRIGRTSRRVVVCSAVLLGSIVLSGLIPWRLVAAEPKPDRKENQPQHFYRAEISVNERKKDQPEEQLSAPRLVYSAGHWAFAACQNHREGQLVVMVSTSPEGQPVEHTMQVLAFRDPSAPESSKEDTDRRLMAALKRIADIDRKTMQDLPKVLWFPLDVSLVDGTPAVYQMSMQCNGRATTANSQCPDGSFGWMSPKIMFSSGATSKVVVVRDDASELRVNVTVSPADRLATAIAESGGGGEMSLQPPVQPRSYREGDLRPSQDVGKDTRTLAAYEAVSNPLSAQIGRKPYRMDAETYGIVVSNDAKGETCVAGVNKRTGEWKWLEMPKSEQVLFEPIMGDDVTAFIQHGYPLSQLVVYNGRLNKWSAFPLRDRVIDVVPCVGDHVVCYQLPHHVVAYSAERDAWGMLATDATPAVGDHAVTVETAAEKSVFTVESGTWVTTRPSTGTSR